jgi:sialate O-acetylesterase
MKKLAFTFLFACAITAITAQVKLPALISDGMVLQRDMPLKIWGWAAANEKVSLKFNNKNYKTKADTHGNWLIMLPAVKAGGPYTMTISGSNTITLKDILFGDVWFCSGQSNMVHQLNIHDVTYAKDIAEANFPEIRQFLVPNLPALQQPQKDFPAGTWKTATAENIRPFSAVAYFFAKNIYDQYHIPVGLINASVGGTPVEAWTSEEGLKDFSALIATIQKNKDTAYVNGTNRAAAAALKPQRSKDLGMLSEKKWYAADYIPSGWRNIAVPGFWEDQGIKDLNGVVWFRKEIELPASMAGEAAKVFLGRIVDADVLYINGQQVGTTTYQYPQRRYAVPPGLLKAGKNNITVRITNTNGKGGFVPDKPYCLFTATDTIDLKGYWQYKVGEVFEPGANSGLSSIAAQNQPTALFNGMVAPATNYNISGILWYQGESNAGRPEEYIKLLPALIADWRQQWNKPALPFLYVQLPNYMEANYLPAESNWAILRQAQLKTLAVPNTAMAVTIDLGEWNDIHPDNKKDVGIRLALAARKLVYKESIVSSGPVYQSCQKEKNSIILSFTNIGSGLTSHDGEELGEFALAGADKKFRWAKARIEGNKVILWSDNVPDPVYVRYAWADNPVNPNLYNKEGLPASPFEAAVDQ